jgi:hypothetical protein
MDAAEEPMVCCFSKGEFKWVQSLSFEILFIWVGE